MKFLYPSSIAAYGLPDLATKQAAGRVREDDFNHPTTMYGANKLYCEMLGRYYARHYKQLAAENLSGKVDFRSVRFPGLISAVTVPSGGTSDYAPEMIHAAARGEPYACFVRPDTRIPFMAMPDGVEALIRLAEAPRERLTRTAYNVAAFNPSAAEIERVVRAAFPAAEISYVNDVKRQGIVDSWPAAVGRLRGACRLGLCAAIRLRARVQRVPDPDDQAAVSVGRKRLPTQDRRRVRRHVIRGLRDFRNSRALRNPSNPRRSRGSETRTGVGMRAPEFVRLSSPRPVSSHRPAATRPVLLGFRYGRAAACLAEARCAQADTA